MTALNIRNESDAASIAKLADTGFAWGTVVPRGANKGRIISKHRSYEAAEKAAANLDRAIVDLRDTRGF